MLTITIALAAMGVFGRYGEDMPRCQNCGRKRPITNRGLCRECNLEAS